MAHANHDTSSSKETEHLAHRIRAITSMPTLSTLKHLALALRDGFPAQTTLQIMWQELEIQYCMAGPSRIDTFPSSAAGAAEMLQQIRRAQTDGLTSLPVEILEMVKAYLGPADAVCLAQTCGMLRAMLDYRLPDVQRFALAWVREKRLLGMRFRECVFEVTERLDRDALRLLDRRACVSISQDLRACGSCVKLHPLSSFPFSGTGRVFGRRQCSASLRRIPICSNWSPDLAELRYYRRALLTRVGGRDTISAPSDTIPHLPSTAMPGQCERHACELRVNHRDELVVVHCVPLTTYIPQSQLSFPALHSLLTANFPSLRLCAHVRLGDRAAHGGYYRPRRRGSWRSAADGDDVASSGFIIRGEELEMPRRDCVVCGTGWWIHVQWQGDAARVVGRPGRMQWVAEGRVVLGIRRVVGALREPVMGVEGEGEDGGGVRAAQQEEDRDAGDEMEMEME